MYPNKILIGALLAIASASIAQADNRAGSLLLFPEYDNQQGVHTLLTITNTNTADAVTVEIIYIDGDDCQEFNRNIELTPADTYTFLTSDHNPSAGSGYAYAFAKDSATGGAISFNHLVGESFRLSAYNKYTLNPYVFTAIGEEGSATDLNGDGLRNLDGSEYSQAPDTIVVPRFFGQGSTFTSYLYLIGLSGGTQFATTVEFLVYNDNEQVFSTEYTFECWDRVRLRDISELFTNEWLENYTDDDPDEIYGYDRGSAGWFEMDGAEASSIMHTIDDPAVIAFLREGKNQQNKTASLPFASGEQGNGSLLANSLTGE
jgi:hypothetical protein